MKAPKVAPVEDKMGELPQNAQKRPWSLRSILSALEPRYGWANLLAVQLLVVTLLLRLLWLVKPGTAAIFDEVYYVNAARMILGWTVPEGSAHSDGQPGLDPNTGHLPLVKVIIAGSMRLFGDNAFGWRLPSVVFGTLAVGLLYLMVRRLTIRPWLALLAAFIFSFDNLVFVHSRIATLDIYMVALMLLGVYAYVAHRPALAGSAMALSALAKLNGVFGLLAIVGFEVLRYMLRPESRPRLGRTVSNLLVVFGSFIVVSIGVLWPLDHFFTTFQSPVDHIAYVYNFGINLRRDSGPQGIESMPWQWLLNEVPIEYYKEAVNTVVDDKVVSSRTTILFLGKMNQFVIAAVPFALAYMLYAAIKKKEDQLSLVMLALAAATFTQPLVMALFFHRISYIFYFLSVLPALCAGIAYFLLDSRLPRIVPVAYSVSVLLAFLSLFPFRTFP